MPFHSQPETSPRIFLLASYIFLLFRQAPSSKYLMLTSEKTPQNSGVNTAAMPETQSGDLTSWSETDFEEKCTYIVKDQPLEEEPENNSRTRAERSLPRNLALKRCHNSAEVPNELEPPGFFKQPETLEFYRVVTILIWYTKPNPLMYLSAMQICAVVVLRKRWLFASLQHPSNHLSILRQEDLDMLLSNFSLSSLLCVCWGKRVSALPGVPVISSLPGFPGHNNTVKHWDPPLDR